MFRHFLEAFLHPKSHNVVLWLVPPCVSHRLQYSRPHWHQSGDVKNRPSFQENKNLAVFVIDSQGVISLPASFEIGSEIFFLHFFFTHFHGDLPLCSELPFITGDPCGEPHLLQSAHVHECSNDPLITRIHSSLGGVKPPAYVCVCGRRYL